MKTILVPTEQTSAMEQTLNCALLLAEKFAGRIEGFALRPAVAEMVAMDPDAGMTMVAVKENDADMVRQGGGIVPRFHAAPRRAAAIRRGFALAFRRSFQHNLGLEC